MKIEQSIVFDIGFQIIYEQCKMEATPELPRKKQKGD